MLIARVRRRSAARLLRSPRRRLAEGDPEASAADARQSAELQRTVAALALLGQAQRQLPGDQK
jgi:hypothetical protein